MILHILKVGKWTRKVLRNFCQNIGVKNTEDQKRSNSSENQRTQGSKAMSTTPQDVF